MSIGIATIAFLGGLRAVTGGDTSRDAKGADAQRVTEGGIFPFHFPFLHSVSISRRCLSRAIHHMSHVT